MDEGEKEFSEDLLRVDQVTKQSQLDDGYFKIETRPERIVLKESLVRSRSSVSLAFEAYRAQERR